MKKESLFFPIIDNGGRLSRTSWGASMFALGVSGVLAGRRIVYDHSSHPDPSWCMNVATATFLFSGCDRMVIIDTDEIFTPRDVERLISHDLPLVSGLYPKKTLDLEFPIMPLGDETPEEMLADDAPSTVRVACVPRGFLSIHRSVFETLKPHVPARQNEHGETIWRFWQGDPGVESEDFAFCNLWRKHGGEVWLDHKIRVYHEGSAVFPLKGKF